MPACAGMTSETALNPDRSGMSRLRADGLLLVTAFLWGATFVVQKNAVGELPPFAFVAARFGVSAVALAPLALFERRRRARPLGRGARKLALAIGLSLFMGTSLQQAGLETTTATNGGFLTACYVVLTPLVVWALSGVAPRALVVAASLVSLIGAWLLATGGGPAQPPAIGDGLLLVADFAWATGIALTPLYLIRGGRPLALAFAQYAMCGGLAALCSLLFEHAEPQGFVVAAPWILFAGLVSGALAYTLQIFAQAHTPPAEAALILSLESVFAAIAGALILGERLSLPGAIGCLMILLGAVAVEAAPALLRWRGARA
jgi:drug/metabolite transporter (DMT)-like permease